METNFFQALASINTTGEYTLHVKQIDREKLVVSILFKRAGIDDPASTLIPPLTFKMATPQEYDRDFFDSITVALPGTAQIFCDMDHYTQQQQVARAEAKMNKDKAEVLAKAKSDKEKKYAAAMQKVAERKQEGKHREAWTLVPNASDFPDHADEIQNTKAELSKLFAPDLFNA